MSPKLQKYFFVIPILYLFVAIFVARSKVQYVYLAAAILVAITVFAQFRTKQKPLLSLAQWMSSLSAIGLSAAVILSIEKIELLADPGRIASCSLSPIVSCTSVIASPQASAFGFANSFFGVFGFAAVLTAAMTLAAGATKLSKMWWRTLVAGMAGGAVFSSWLIYQGLFDIGKLCLYCLLVWLVSFGLLWLTASYCIDNKHINLGTKLNKLLSYKYELIATTYVIIFALIFFRWSDYWVSLF